MRERVRGGGKESFAPLSGGFKYRSWSVGRPWPATGTLFNTALTVLKCFCIVSTPSRQSRDVLKTVNRNVLILLPRLNLYQKTFPSQFGPLDEQVCLEKHDPSSLWPRLQIYIMIQETAASFLNCCITRRFFFLFCLPHGNFCKEECKKKRCKTSVYVLI